MTAAIQAYNSCLPQIFETVNASRLNDLSFRHGRVAADRSSRYFPARSDEKVMREDVKASIVTIGEMLAGIAEEERREHIGLYVANGVFMEDSASFMDRMRDLYEQIGDAADSDEKSGVLYRSTPPLLALQTLTNSAMSFIAQYACIKGHNASFGCTSYSGFCAIQQAASVLENTLADRSLVCASNCAGVYSYLSFSPLFEDPRGWTESMAVACLLLCPEETGSQHCKITAMKSSAAAISLGSKKITRTWAELAGDELCPYAIFSGAYTDRDYRDDAEYCAGFAIRSFSFYPQYGNTGPANIPMAVIHAIDVLKAGQTRVDIFDRDPYGRESYIRVEV